MPKVALRGRTRLHVATPRQAKVRPHRKCITGSISLQVAQGVTVGSGAEAGVAFELTGEVVAVPEAAVEGDIGDAPVGGGEDFAGPLEAQFEQELNRRRPGRGAETAKKRADGHAGSVGEFFKLEVVVE